MSVTVSMPQLGETVTEGTILRWAKQPGDAVAVDEVLFEVSTDKVDTEVPSPSAGVILEILVAEGETVAVGTANFKDPQVSLEIVEGIEAYLVEHGMSGIKDLIGSLEIVERGDG